MAQESTTMQVWRFLAAYLRDNGNMPTLREIADGCFLSRAAVTRHLVRLEERGAIELMPRRARGIKLREQPPPTPS